jgi:rod shape-determining protein MreC
MSKLQTRSLIVVILLGASLALAGLNRTGALEPVKNVLSLPLTALQRWTGRTLGGLVNVFQSNPEVDELRRRNAELEQEVAQLQTQVTGLQETEAELKVLSALVNYARTQPENRYLAATIIGRDSSPFLRYLLLDKGSDAGVQRDMPVVSSDGLVGRIVEVTSAASKVQLIVDSGAEVNAMLQQSRERGVVSGQVAGGLQMQYLSQDVKVEPGDVVLTSGLGGTYPQGLVIGTVGAVQQLNYEVLQSADVVPAVNFNRLEIILIITNFQPVDFSPFFQTTPTPALPAP